MGLMRALLAAHAAILPGWFIAAAGLMLPLFAPCLPVGIAIIDSLYAPAIYAAFPDTSS